MIVIQRWMCVASAACALAALLCGAVRAEAQTCRTQPTRGTLAAPSILWEWTGDAMVAPTFDQVMMTPTVAQLDDDNGDGLINENDMPDVLFVSFEDADFVDGGYLRALNGDGSRKWPAATPSFLVSAQTGVAVGELDASSPGPEIAACGQSGVAIMLAADGSLLRQFGNDFSCGLLDPVAIADVDNDGVAEIALGRRAFKGDGTLVGRIPAVIQAVYDVDGDGRLEAISGLNVWRFSGNTVDPVWTMSASGEIGIADLDSDGDPDIVNFGSSDIQARDAATGDLIWMQTGPTPLSGFGGSVSIADIDGDDRPEIAHLRNEGDMLVVYEGESGTVKWDAATSDLSGRIGTTAADLNFDGQHEFIHRDEVGMYIYNATGGERHYMCAPSETLRERPVVADVDGNDRADILIAVNDYGVRSFCRDGSRRRGLQVWSNRDWSGVRKIWNQAEYHITNVCEGGRIPTFEAENWTVFNDYNAQTGIELLPDLTVRIANIDTLRFPTEIEFTAEVTNLGEKTANAGVSVAFFTGEAGNRAGFIGTALTEEALRPMESTEVDFEWTDPPDSADPQGEPVWASVDDDGMALSVYTECDEANNTDAALYSTVPDTDGDGILNVDECGGMTSACFDIDTDGDGAPDFQDVDDDNDGIFTSVEIATGRTGNAPADFDQDGIPNHLDLDTDNDGIPDLWENGWRALDTDKDGVVDGVPVDQDDDGLIDAFPGEDDNDPSVGDLPDPINTDEEGLPDFADLEADGDQINDIIEARGIDADDNGVVDTFEDPNGNGYAALVDPGDAGTALEIPDTDGDTALDFQDFDADGDGVNDIDERFDLDNNGIIDALEANPNRGGLTGGALTGCAIGGRGGAGTCVLAMLALAALAWRRYLATTC